MSNNTIQIGIDLGTANSKIALNIEGKIEIIKKPGGVEYTPSVFGFDKSGNKVVGQKAYDHLYKFNERGDAENFYAETKRVMGTAKSFSFTRTKIKMAPEDIAAEILKSLKEDLLRKYPDFDSSAAVITVPAAFSVLQSEATKRAGEKAGFKYVVLLQEPIAAAVSYGFMNAKNENWLIYDFGGGTFDLALISCKDGVLSVLGHGGEEYLGGKDIDWDIVNNIIKPKILETYKFSDFNRSNSKYEHLFARLKYFAETAKMELSQYIKTTIEIEEVGKDEANKEVSISISLTREDFNKLIEKRINRTIDLTKRTIAEAGFKEAGIKKIILVGGTTIIPYIREKLEDEFNISVDSSVDPLTVVARGACIFGISQKIPKEFLVEDKKVGKGVHNISLNHVTLTADTEESITGIIEGLDDKDDYFIQMQADAGTFSGPKIKVNKGKFYYSVKLQKNKENKYWIYLFDSKSNPIKIAPESFTITHGLSVSGAPLPHSIKVVVAREIKNVCEPIFEKGKPLPLKTTIYDYKTSRKLTRGEDNSLDIKLVEGESDIEDRNVYVCELGIPGKELSHDLAAGTPIELTVELNESRELTVTAYIPLMDITFNARATLKDEEIDTANISDELNTQRKRAEAVYEDCSEQERKRISENIQAVSEGLSNSKIDEDEKRKTNKELKNLKTLLDDIEAEKAVPQLIKDYNKRVQEVQKIINEYADPKEKEEDNKQLERIKGDGEVAIKEQNKMLLIRLNEQLSNLGNRAAFSNPNTWIAYYRQVVTADNFINQQEAQYYINKCNEAITAKNWEELKRCVTQLNLLRPVKEQKGVNLSGISR